MARVKSDVPRDAELAVEELKRDEEEGLCESPRAEVAQAGCTSPSGFTSGRLFVAKNAAQGYR
jgi:hypothetical protein